jgi:hypothetical protein
MRPVARAVLCVGVLLAAAACDPATDNRYFYEGAGKDLYSTEGANQTALLQEYINYICDQAGYPGGTCSPALLVEAGMNDIDRRCDAYLTWLDGQRRNKEPVLAELSALNTATHAIMTVTGVGPEALDIVTAAFGLATATYANWNSRLMLAINQSTVQEIVYSSQGQFRNKIRNYNIVDQPYAIYLLRNYLRLCMPITIEANINVSATLVQTNPTAAKESTVVKSVMPVMKIQAHYGADQNTQLIRQWLRERSGRLAVLRAFLTKINPALQVGTFLSGGEYVAQRAEFVREQKISQ